MKKFISIFLVISMIICNLNNGVVEALSTYGNEVKSLVNTLTNTEKEKSVRVEEDKGLEKETAQVSINNQVDNTNIVASKNEDNEVQKSLDKKLSNNSKGNVKQNIILFFDISTETFYYIDSENKPQPLDLLNAKISKNKINLNNMITSNNLIKSEDSDSTIENQEVTLVITGDGDGVIFGFDNEYIEIPFNIVFHEITARNCSFSFENVRSIRVNGENTIENSPDDNTALTYSFDEIDSNPLKIDDRSSFIVYNTDKDNINSNIIYSDNSGDDSDNSGDDSDNSGDDSDNSGYSSVVNISFEKDNIPGGKKFILDPVVNNNGTQKSFSTKEGYDVLSILLLSDNKSYILREDNNQIPYYYKTSNSIDESGVISGPIKTKITLNKNGSQYCYDVSNEKRVEVIANEDYNSNYYLVNNLKEAMENYVNLEGASHEVIFLGNYDINSDDVKAIKDYNQSTNGITFKTKVDEWLYLLNIDEDIELSVSDSSNEFSIIFNDIKFNYISTGKWIYANGRQLKFGDNVIMDGPNYPSILLGGKSQDFKSGNNSYLVIDSGTYGYVIGQHNGTLKDMNVVINGGIFNNKVIAVNGKVVNNAKLTINNNNSPIFRGVVVGASTSSDIGNSLSVSINGGSFSNEVIAVNGKVVNDAILTIGNNPIFRGRVVGASSESNIGNSLSVSIKNGTFNNEVIGITGGTAKKVILTITNGNFNGTVNGALSNTNIEKFTLKGMFNKYLFNRNAKIAKPQVDGSNSVVSINVEIKGGTFKDNVIGTDVSNSILTMTIGGGTFKTNLIGNGDLAKGNAIININGNITIPIISNFTNLVVDGSKKGILKVDKLDKGSSTGDLYLKNGSKITFRSTSETSELNDIVLQGKNNTLVLTPSNRTKDRVLINSSGELKNNANKLNINLSNKKTINEMYLIKFDGLEKADVTDKYNLQTGYYVRDNKENGYVILCSQTTFDLKYNFENDTLYMIDSNNNVSEAWWYTGNSSDVTFDTNSLYRYKGYDLFNDSKSKGDRNITLTGNSSNKTFTINNSLSNLNVTLNKINLIDSKIILNDLKSLIINGENSINNVNTDQDAFTYTLNDKQVDNKVSFVDATSHLRIFTKENINPFNGYKGCCMDFKFLQPFTDETTVRVKDNNQNQLKFKVPANTQRLGLLINSDAIYNLYYGESDETGTSVYVSGNTDETFKDSFTALSDSGQLYEYVRRANPVKSIQVDIPNPMNFRVNTSYTGIEGITKQNWKKCFKATDMIVENNSIIIKDQFINNGKKQNIGEKNINLEFGYLGVSSLHSYNDIKLISSSKLDPNVINSTDGVKLALKFSSASGDIAIDEDEGIKSEPVKTWIVPSKTSEILKIEPDFGNNNHFFNVTSKEESTFESSHKFTFRFELKY